MRTQRHSLLRRSPSKPFLGTVVGDYEQYLGKGGTATDEWKQAWYLRGVAKTDNPMEQATAGNQATVNARDRDFDGSDFFAAKDYSDGVQKFLPDVASYDLTDANASLSVPGFTVDELTTTTGSDLFDADAYLTGTGAWGEWGNNVLTTLPDENGLSVTYVDSSNGARVYLRDSHDLTTDLTVGTVYVLQYEAKVSAGGKFDVYIYDGDAYPIPSRVDDINHTDWRKYKVTIYCETANGHFMGVFSLGAGEIAYLRNITLHEAANPNLQQLAVANDEVLSGTDLITDGTFSNWTADDLDDWTEFDSDASESPSGVAEVTLSAGDGGIYQDVAVEAGARYKVGFSYMNASGDVARFSVYDNDNAAFIIDKDIDLENSDSLVAVSRYFTAPAGCTSVRIAPRGKSNGDVVSFDNVSMEKVTTVRTPATYRANLYDSTPTLIASGFIGEKPTPNILTNGTFDSATTGWTADATAGTATISSVASGQSGNCLQIENDAGGDFGYAYQSATLVVGEAYTLTYYQKNGSSGANVKIGSAKASQSVTNKATSTGSWTQYSIDFTAATATTFFSFMIDGDGDGNTTLYDEIVLTGPKLTVTTGAAVIDEDGTASYFTTLGTGWSHDAANDEWDCDGSQVASTFLTKQSILTDAKAYKVTYTVKNYSAGSVWTSSKDGGPIVSRTANGTYTEYHICDANTHFYVGGNSAFVGSVDDILVEPVTAFGTDATRIYKEASLSTRGYTITGSGDPNDLSSVEVYKVLGDDNLTGDQFFGMFLEPDDGQPDASAESLITIASGTNGEKSLYIQHLTDGRVVFYASEDGTVYEALWHATATFADGAQSAPTFIGFFLDKTNGTGLVNINGEDKAITETISAGTLFDTFYPLTIGALQTGANYYNGKISRLPIGTGTVTANDFYWFYHRHKLRYV